MTVGGWAAEILSYPKDPCLFLTSDHFLLRDNRKGVQDLGKSPIMETLNREGALRLALMLAGTLPGDPGWNPKTLGNSMLAKRSSKRMETHFISIGTLRISLKTQVADFLTFRLGLGRCSIPMAMWCL